MIDNKETKYHEKVYTFGAAGYVSLIALGIFTVTCVGMSIAYGGDPGGLIGIFGGLAIIIGVIGWHKSLKAKIQREQKARHKTLEK